MAFDTVDIERALLKLVTTSQMACRAHLHTLKDELFTSAQRKFILTTAQVVFADTRSMLSNMVFDYEVKTKIDASEAAHYAAEWSFIHAKDVTETPEILISKLEEAQTGRKVLQLGEDIIGLLEHGQISDAVSHLKQTAVTLGNKSADRKIVNLTDIAVRKQMILDKRAHPEKYLGIKTGFKTFDLRTGGLFAGELTLLAGVTGVGKSTLVKQIERGIVTLNHKKNVLHIANEEYQEQVEHKFDAGFMEIPYLDFKLATITDADLARWEAYMSNWKYGHVFLKEVPAFTDVTLVEQAFYELQNKGYAIDVIVIDHLPHIKPIQRTWDPNDELKKAASDCKELAKSLHVSCVVPTQAATIVADKQAKGNRAGQLDVYGSKGQIHVANSFMIITEQGKDTTQTDREEWEQDTFWLCDVKKNRDGGKFWFRAKHHVRNGKVEEVFEQAGAVAPKTDPAVQAAAAGALAEGNEKIAKQKAESETKAKAELEQKQEDAIVEVEPPADGMIEEEDEAESAPPTQIPEASVPKTLAPQPVVAPSVPLPPVAVPGGVPTSAFARFRKR
jgi:replicative DNA helicase